MKEEEKPEQQIAKLEREIAKLERERIKFLLLEGKVDEAFNLMERIIKRKMIERWLKSEEKEE